MSVAAGQVAGTTGQERYPYGPWIDFALPVAIAAVIAWAIIAEPPRTLGLAANATCFMVGWYYVKQRYGVAMVGAVRKRAFFCERQTRVLPDRTLPGNSLVFFVCWIFINVHHYRLDTVMRRKGNPDVARYLFLARV